MRVPSVRVPAATVLVAAVFLVLVELLRAASPLLDLTTSDLGVIGAARLAMLIFAAPVLLGPLVGLAGPIRGAAGLVLVLVLLRLVTQAQDPPTLPVVGAAAAVGIGALVLVLRLAPTGLAAVTGILLGTVADLAIRAAAGSWDPIHRPGLLPWLLPVMVGAVAVLALVSVVRAPGDAGRRAGRVGAVGPYLALYLMGYGSAPILAGHAGVSLPVASAVLLGTAAAGMELVRQRRLVGAPSAGLVAVLGLAGGFVAGYWLAGPAALAGLVVAGLSAAVLLTRALTSPRGRGGFTVAGLAAGLGYVLPVMVYQVDYDLEFPFDNRLVLVAFAVLLGLAGLGSRPAAPVPQPEPPEPEPAEPRSARPAPVTVLAVVALLLPLALVATRPSIPDPDQAGDSVRLMSWNLMYGRDPVRGDIDLAAIADAVAAVDPDVLVLQEVARGWPIGGGVDVAEWLSRRLRMRYEWAPAASAEFGNALLTRLPYSDVEVDLLPYGQGPMERSYLATTLQLAGGAELRLFATHFQHRTENTPTRLAQTETLLAAWDGAPRTVIAGDFNFWPSWPEADEWEAAGFVSAQDVTGHGAEFTVPSHDPDNRVDWIFGTPDLTFSDFAILDQVTASDHLPLVVTVTVG